MGVGKARSMTKMVHGRYEKAAPVTRTTLRTTGPVPANSRQRTPLVRTCMTRLTRDWPDSGWRHEKIDAVAKAGGIPTVRTRFSLSAGNERADAWRDTRTCLARPNSQAWTGTYKISFSVFRWPRAGLATIPGWSTSIPSWKCWQYITYKYFTTCILYCILGAWLY